MQDFASNLQNVPFEVEISVNLGTITFDSVMTQEQQQQ